MTNHKRSQVFSRRPFGGSALMATFAWAAALLFCFSAAWPGQARAGETKPYQFNWSIAIEVPEMDNPEIADALKDWVGEFVHSMIPGDSVPVNLGEGGGSWSVSGKPQTMELTPGTVSVLYELKIRSKAGPGEEEIESDLIQAVNFDLATGKQLFLWDLFEDSNKATEIIAQQSRGSGSREIHRFDTFVPRDDCLLMFYNPRDVSDDLEYPIKISVELKDLRPAGLKFKGWK